MHRQTGIAAGLATATAIIAIAADPAAADPGPLPLPSIVVDLLPDRSPTTGAAEAQTTTTAAAAKPTSSKPITTTDPKTRGTAVHTYGGNRGGAAQRGTANSPAPTTLPTLRPAVPQPAPQPAATGPTPRAAERHGWDDLAALLATAFIAALAMGLMSRRRAPALAPSGLDPASMEAARRIARALDER